jgi:hypothetical protein
MANRLTTEEWVQKAKALWGDTYDYSQVEYVYAKIKVRVICPEHGPWDCKPDLHTSKRHMRGCPVCGGSKRKSYEEFLKDARRVHGNRYEYPKFEYKNSKAPVGIVCEKHGRFEQSPDSHINHRSGCPLCADEERSESSLLSEHEYLRRLEEACHNNDTTVELVPGSYKGMNRPAQVECSKHGLQRPRRASSVILGTHACIDCALENQNNLQYSTESFREMLLVKFNSEYEIGDFEYEGKETLITMACPKPGHGEFTKRAGDFYKNVGCPKCRRVVGLQQRFEAWKREAAEIHEGRYDYSRVDYTDQHASVLIGCPVHGYYEQPPTVHLKSGCRLCADAELKGLYSERFFKKHQERKDDPATLYYLRFHIDGVTFYKVGLTVTSIRKRFAMVIAAGGTFEVLGELRTTLFDAWSRESAIQSTHGDAHRYRPKLATRTPRQLRIGPTECFDEPLPQKAYEKYFAKA